MIRRHIGRRALAGAVAAVLVAGLVPAVAAPAQAAPTVTISGTVKNQQGQPIAARVEVSPTQGGTLVQTTTDAAGAFTLTGVAPGPSSLRAQEATEAHLYTPENWNGTASVTEWVTYTVPGTSVTGVNFVLDPAIGIVGTATDTAGKPLANMGYAVYEWRPAERDWYPPQMGPLLTDDAGRMWWPGTLGTTYRLCFQDNWYDDPAWRPASRYADRCWASATTLAGATDIVLTEQNRRQSVSVALPVEAKSQLPGTPFVTGVIAVGTPVSVDPGIWTPTDVTLSYQWSAFANGTEVAIPGATARTYTPTSDRTGAELSVRVTGVRSGYKTVTRWGYAGVVGRPTPTMDSPLRITGTPAPGQVLTVTHGTITPTAGWPMFSWFVDGQATGAGTSSSNTTYTVTAADRGKRIEVRMEAYASTGYNSLHAAATVDVPAGGLTPVTPTVTGTAAVGSKLTAKAGTWGPAPVTLTYQWYRSGSAISGATASTYTLTPSDRAKTITVRVTGSKPGYATATRTSAATAAVKGLLTAPTPKISGTLAVGSKLTAKPGTWGPSPVTLNYQWYRSGSAISGATKSTYTLVASDRAKTLTVRVTGSRSGYVTAAKASAKTAVVKGVLTAATPKVTGTRKAGSTLKAAAGAWGPKPVTLTYQWYRGSTAISGAKSSSYKLVSADKGKTIKVRVTGAKSGYVSASRYSAATAKIA